MALDGALSLDDRRSGSLFADKRIYFAKTGSRSFCTSGECCYYLSLVERSCYFNTRISTFLLRLEKLTFDTIFVNANFQIRSNF